jgi:hypothetical protein
MSNTFSHAGVSRLKGELKVRFANDALRVKVLAKNGHSDIDIIELKAPMSKEDAVAFLLSIDFDNGNKEVRAALEAAQDKRAPKAAKEKSPQKKETKKAPKPKAAPSLDSIRAKAPKTTVTKAEVEAQLADLEDAPF